MSPDLGPETSDDWPPPPHSPPTAYFTLRDRLLDRLGPNRSPLLVGIDGQNGAAKTSLSNWLGWQLGMPALHLDLYRARASRGQPSAWRKRALAHDLRSRTGRDLPVIVEGVMLLDALEAVGTAPAFLIYVRRRGTTEVNKLCLVLDYLRRRHVALRRADFTLLGR